MNKKIISIAVVVLIAIVGSFAFTKLNNKKEDKPQGIKIANELGEVTVNKKPKNVVVFDYGVLDALNKMGVDVKAMPKSSLPSYLSKFKGSEYTDAGALFEPNFEKISELKPELIIIGGRQKKLSEEFKKIAPTILMNTEDNDYIGSFSKNVKTLGEIFDKQDVVEKELKQINDKIENLNKKVKESGKNALVVMASDGALSAYGEGSRFGMIHKEFGVPAADKKVESSNHGQKISFEYLVEKNPDNMLVIDRTAIAGGKVSAKQALENDLVKTTKAYKENKITYLTPEIWYISTGGLEATNKMIDEIESAMK
ncbi:iron complex transport system substrate-binding protein [Clostridium cavendishii DSM 21758]|uniref:Iron complex transport system substrate-binding protein n=1 Tax=Clostridium cavendishii DSM 21758 TaxID=1121302 RepID=A0A1M6UMD5_9CLOT|nr:siderophore ABC transporter substrate-binding protein [Clostridium cavendishii]SHK70394.1 iron complex transport system substrate-binding protein [Clostridium cavendishii DSM 21758]